jgi:C1A family cysteine protease
MENIHERRIRKQTSCRWGASIMKKNILYLGIVLLVSITCNSVYGQHRGAAFEMEGGDTVSIDINQYFSATTEIMPFGDSDVKVYGLSLDASVALNGPQSLVRFILVDKNFKEYLVYETYELLESSDVFDVEGTSEETAILNGVKMQSLRVEVEDATVLLSSLTYSTKIDPGTDVETIQKLKRKAQNEEKIALINQQIKAKGLHWLAGSTNVSEMSYSDRMQLYGGSKFPPAIEFYAGGAMSFGETEEVPVAASPMIDEWDWRNRHGKDWVSPVTNQGNCGSCWAFAAVGATEAMTNLYFNQQLNLDLSEQDVLSCSGAGSCSGGYPAYAIDYISSAGIVGEGAFPYAAHDLSCSDKDPNPSEKIKAGGRMNWWTGYPNTEDGLKQMIIERGPLAGTVENWSHAMTLVGYKVIQEGDYIHYANGQKVYDDYWRTISAGDPLIGKTVWTFKNSWGSGWGDNGYAYFEVPLSQLYAYAVKTPITSLIRSRDVIYEDNDGDGYYWWGLSSKPAECPGPDQADGDDSDPTKGPLDQYGYCIPLVEDTTAPTPNPMTWAVPPHATGEDSIAMTATTAQDTSSVEYYFACISDGAHDSGWQASPTYEDIGLESETTYTYTVTARDRSVNQNQTDASAPAWAITDPVNYDDPPYSDIRVQGLVSGSYADTYFSDNQYEAIQEVVQGHRIKGYSSLEHKWLFDIDGGIEVIFFIEAWHSASADGDDFTFAYSTDGANFTDLLTVTKTADGDALMSTAMPVGISGTVYIRVTDTDSTSRNIENDTLYVDQMFIRSNPGLPDDTAPKPDPMTWETAPYATGSNSISMTATTAQDTSGVEYYFACISDGGHDSGWQASPTYEDTGLEAKTTYSYTVKAHDLSTNQNATAESVSASATTDDIATATDCHVEAIDCGTIAGQRPKVRGQVMVTIFDDLGQPVEGAAVEGTFTGNFGETLTATTDSSGVAVFTTTTDYKKPSYTFTVNNVVDTLPYDPSDNVETSDSY